MRVEMAWPEDSWLAGAAWLRSGDDRAAECEVPRSVSEAPAGSEGGEAGAVEVTYEIDCQKAQCFCSSFNSYASQ